MAERRSDKKEDGPAKRQRVEPEAKKQQEPEKEKNLPEQELFGNSFLLDQMLGTADRNQDGPPAGDDGRQHAQLQDYGGIEDGDGAPKRPPAAVDQWFSPRFRKKGEEIEAVGGGPDEPGIPPEDADWIAALIGTGDRWDQPSPQPHPCSLEGALKPWLMALLPIAGPVPSQYALALAIASHPSLQDPSGTPLLGAACCAALGTFVAFEAGASEAGRLRLNRGLAIAGAPEAPLDPARTAAQLVGLPAPGTVPEVPQDAWLARLIVARLRLDRPPVPTLDDPPPPEEPDPDEPVDIAALLEIELGSPPDPIEAVRLAALEACEAQARWGVALRSGSAGIAAALVEAGVDPTTVAAALVPVDSRVGQAVGLLQEIAAAARTGSVAIRGLRNGLGRSARVLTTAHRAAVEGLMAAATISGVVGQLPEPVDADLASHLQDGRPLPAREASPYARTLTQAVEAVTEDPEQALLAGQRVAEDARIRQDGIGVATGALLQLRALEQLNRVDEAAPLRDAFGSRLLGAGARAGLSLLARWEPVQVAAG